ncbi:hypothetical protein PVT67_17940 [Gallaecimonas kandeliae]|uniref:hypothetical protein n=1 Tax=Gallaecimonas kandeliae TaxID=3029055 RepID=UPI0026479827|nr:hypothetical protein [Gallaecimonas kandeliae]WKE65523.1 hypothetical protein PVT67_17940 [Gallaecimonas kandeliae]
MLEKYDKARQGLDQRPSLENVEVIRPAPAANKASQPKPAPQRPRSQSQGASSAKSGDVQPRRAPGYQIHPDAKPPKVGDQTFKRLHPDGVETERYTLLGNGMPLGAEAGKPPSHLKGLKELPDDHEQLVAEGWPTLDYVNAKGQHAEDFANFADAEAVILPEGTTLYRIVDENAYDAGAYWALEKPASKAQWRNGYAVKDDWNDNGYYVSHTVGKGGLKAWKGTVAAQPYRSTPKRCHLPGGQTQLFITPGGVAPTPPQLTHWSDNG